MEDGVLPALAHLPADLDIVHQDNGVVDHGARMMRATREIMDRSRPVTGRANRAPEKATGRIIMMMTGMRKDSNWAARIKYTRPMATSSASSRSVKLSIISS